MKKRIIRSFLKIAVAALLCLVAYIALSVIWLAFVREIEDDTVKNWVIAVGSAVAYSVILFYIVKVRNDVGADELEQDYANGEAYSFVNDIKIIFRREKLNVIMIGTVIFAEFLLITVDTLLFGKFTLQAIAVPFATMFLCGSCFRGDLAFLSFLGYIINFLIIVSLYILLVALHRRRQYRIFLKKKLENEGKRA